MMKCTVTVGFTIRIMILVVSLFMASCSDNGPTERENVHANKYVEEPPYTVIDWYPRPKQLPQAIQPFKVYPHGQSPLMPQPPAAANQPWQAAPAPGGNQAGRVMPPGYVYRDIPSEGSWGRSFEPQQPGSPNTQYSYPGQQYTPRPWGETPAVGAGGNKPASPAVPGGGTFNSGAWQPGYPGPGYPGQIW
jgi:hypothetical protein